MNIYYGYDSIEKEILCVKIQNYLYFVSPDKNKGVNQVRHVVTLCFTKNTFITIGILKCSS